MLDTAVTCHRAEPRQFRQLRKGPEADLQLVIQGQLDQLFPNTNKPTWTAASVPLGAGVPDIIRTSFEPELLALAGIDVVSLTVMAFLRSVGRARPETIGARLGTATTTVERRLAILEESSIVSVNNGTFCLSGNWRCVLPEVVSVEVKVGDWRRAVSQAARNRIFSNWSYVAVPHRVAARVRHEPLFCSLGVGLLGVDESNQVRVVRKARKTKTKAWTYYYSLASMAANELSGTELAIPY